MDKMTCAICDSNKVKGIRGKFMTKYDQVPVCVEDVEMYECNACGERFLTPEQAKAVSIAAKNQIRVRSGLLSPAEISDLRRRLGLSQTELEDLLGLGPKVVTRWETGRVIQEKTADVVLRLLATAPQLVQKLRRMRDEQKAVKCQA